MSTQWWEDYVSKAEANAIRANSRMELLRDLLAAPAPTDAASAGLHNARLAREVNWLANYAAAQRSGVQFWLERKIL